MKMISIYYRSSSLILIILCLILISICNLNNASAASPLVISVSNNQLKLLVKEIIREEIPINVIGSPEKDPHFYEPTANDIHQLRNSSLVILGSENLDEWSANIIPDIESPVFFFYPGCSSDECKDQSIWLIPQKVVPGLERLLPALCKLSANSCQHFTDRFITFKNSILSLDEEFLKKLQQARQRNFAVVHPGWHTFANHYNLNQIGGVQECEMGRLTFENLLIFSQMVRRNNIKKILSEHETEEDHLPQIIKDLNLQPISTDPLGLHAANYSELLNSNFLIFIKILE